MAYNEHDNLQAHNELMYILSKQGYAPYSRLLRKFYLYLTDDPDTIAAMIPNQYIIIMNPENLGCSMKKASFAVRHEILHQYLDHALRSVQHLGQEVYDGRTPAMHDRLNRAQDYEIHDIGITHADEEIVRELKGLLLCDDHRDWVGLTFEEIYDRLEEEEPPEPPTESGDEPEEDFPPDFIEGWRAAIEAWNNGELQALDDLEDDKPEEVDY